jgi:hypothetical protein
MSSSSLVERGVAWRSQRGEGGSAGGRRGTIESWPCGVRPGGAAVEWEECCGSERGKDNDEFGRQRAG